jgi:hypothetical protein
VGRLKSWTTRPPPRPPGPKRAPPRGNKKLNLMNKQPDTREPALVAYLARYGPGINPAGYAAWKPAFEAGVSALAQDSERLRSALLVLVNAVENHEDITEGDYDETLEHNFNASFKPVIASLKKARLALHPARPEQTEEN